MTERLERLEAVMARTGLSRTEIWRRRDAGAFPEPVKIQGGRIKMWVGSEVDQWIADTVAAARGNSNNEE